MKKITLLLFAIIPLMMIGQNLAPNPTLNGATSWSDLNAGTGQGYNATDSYLTDGSGLWIIVSNGTFNSGIKSSNIAQSALTAGDYTFSYYVRGAAGAKTKPIIRDNGLSSNQNIQGDPYIVQFSNTWELVTQTFSISAAGTINLRAMINDDTPGATIEVDEFSLTYIPPTGNTLTVNTIGGGNVALTLDKISYDPSDNEILTANPATHWDFDSWSGDLTGTTNPEMLLMDDDKTVTANFVIEPAFNYAFTFDSDPDLEGWTLDPQLALTSHTGGKVTLTPTTDQWARFNLFDFPIPTASYNKVTITLENNSTNDDQINVIVINGVDTEVLLPQTMTTGSGTYEFDLTTVTNWTGDVDSIRIRFADADNPTTGRSSGTGNIIIDDIVFEFDPSLSSADYNKVDFVMYPNPAKDVLYFKSIDRIKSVNIYDVTGKSVIQSNKITDDQIDVSNLRSGIYIVKLESDKGDRGARKLVIK